MHILRSNGRSTLSLSLRESTVAQPTLFFVLILERLYNLNDICTYNTLNTMFVTPADVISTSRCSYFRQCSE